MLESSTMTDYCAIWVEDPVAPTKPRRLRQPMPLKSDTERTHLLIAIPEPAAQLALPASQPPREQTPRVTSYGSTDSLLSSKTSASSGPSKKPRRLFVWLVVSMIAYLVAGAYAFGHLEADNEMRERMQFRAARQDFLSEHEGIRDDDLEEFIQQVARLSGHGVSALRNATAPDANWSFGQAFFFAGTVITTIGYGHITPMTQGGKLFCVVFAVIGIPLTLVLMTAAVDRLLVPAGWLLARMQSRFGHLYEPFNVRVMHLMIIVTICSLLFFAIPTALFVHLEPTWSAVDAFYYCFITLTTIGLGDYIPGDQPFQQHRSLYKVLVTVYLMLGLCAVMLCMSIYYDIPQLNMGQLFSESHAAAAAQAASKAAGGGSGGCGGGGGSGGQTESTRLSLSGRVPLCYSSGAGPSGLYIPQRDDEVRRSVVRIRPRGDESPSPDEEQAPMCLGEAQ